MILVLDLFCPLFESIGIEMLVPQVNEWLSEERHMDFTSDKGAELQS